MINKLYEIAAVIKIGLSSLPYRVWSSIVTVIAIAIVTAMLTAFIAMANGFKKTQEGGASEDILIVIKKGAISELNSSLSHEQFNILSTAPAILDEEPEFSPELYVVVNGIKKATQNDANLPLRGIYPSGAKFRKSFEVTQGRMFQPGKNELIVGQSVLNQFSGFELGRKIKFGKTPWTVVGVFGTNGSVAESEIWSDVRDVQSQFQRENSYQTVRIKQNNTSLITKLRDFSELEPRLDIKIETEVDYLAEQGRALQQMVVVGWILSLLMSIGVIAGALNTMYNSVSVRSREIATLRAIGFGKTATFIGTFSESIILSLVGGVLGVLASYILFDGLISASIGLNFTQVVFSFELSWPGIKDGLLLAVAIGTFGGFFPAWRAIRIPITQATQTI